MTFLHSLLTALQVAAEFNPNYETRPACVLWPDKERLWESLAELLRQASPSFFQLGEHCPQNRTGSALWLKCALANLLPEAPLHSEILPIIYLPGVSRTDLRDAESCPPEWHPLVELQYRGVTWSHPNGRDWTVVGFLTAKEGGLGLDVARDSRTAVALQQSLTKLAAVPVPQLQTQQIDGDFLLGLLHPDKTRDVLLWLSDSGAFRGRHSAEQWNAFTAVCRGSFQFDPEKDGEIRAAELLGLQKELWREAWSRFKEAPRRYPGVAEWLRRARPPTQMELRLAEAPYDGPSEAWPQVNEEGERELRSTLEKIQGKSQAGIVTTLIELEAIHGKRRTWVWADLGQSPLACVWNSLVDLARRSEKTTVGTRLEDLATYYDAEGWKTDAAALTALAAQLSESDRTLVQKVVRALYLPWLEETARIFQLLARPEILAFQIRPMGRPPAGTVILFADALRLDVGETLRQELAGTGVETKLVCRWSAIPSVTPTAKPAVSPIAHLLSSDLAATAQEIAAFRPSVTAEHKPLTPERFRKLLEAEGIQFLSATESGDVSGVAWTEHGRLDADGHHEGVRLALRCGEHVSILAERVHSLLAAGWRHVRIVTDHGWLLVPGGLPKAELPKFLTDSRWGRCAVLAAGAETLLPTWPWAWAPAVSMVCAPGATSFIGGLEYTHGGMTLQECRIPEIHVSGNAAEPAPNVRVVAVRWVNLRCRVSLEGHFQTVQVDLRLRPADANSSVVEAPRGADTNGLASLALVRDDLIGASASLILVIEGGRVARRVPITLGEDFP